MNQTMHLRLSLKWLLALFLGACVGPSRAAAGSPPELFALVIGYNGGRPGLADLRYADDDAVRFALFFAGLNPEGATDRISLLAEVDAETRAGLDKAGLAVFPKGLPTRRQVFSAFRDLAQRLAARPRGTPRVLYVVYAGHGLHGRILLRPETATEAALTGAELRSALADLSAVDPDLKTFIFVDACRSESLFAERGDGEPDFGAAITAFDRPTESASVGILTAAQNGKPAGELRSLHAGYFSHVLVSGLSGAADANADDIVTFGELAAFVAFNTQRLTGQLPWFSAPNGDLNLRAIDHRGLHAKLVFSAAAPGRYLVAATGGLPVFVEVFAPLDRALRLVLPAGRYQVVRTLNNRRTFRTSVELRPDESVDLSVATWAESQSRGDDDSKDDPGSESWGFTAPFSNDVVSTLSAGYHAGRKPVPFANSSRYQLGLMVGVGPAPLELSGTEPTLALHLRRRERRWFLGATLQGGRSAHRTDVDEYRLTRVGGLVQGGAVFEPNPMTTLHIGFGAGFASTLRSGAGPLSGDPLGPLLAANLGLDLRLHGPWFLAAEARVQSAWIKIDGDRRRSTDPRITAGGGFWF